MNYLKCLLEGKRLLVFIHTCSIVLYFADHCLTVFLLSCPMSRFQHLNLKYQNLISGKSRDLRELWVSLSELNLETVA